MRTLHTCKLIKKERASKFLILLALLIVVSTYCFPSFSVYALSDADRKIQDRGVGYFNAQACATNTTSSNPPQNIYMLGDSITLGAEANLNTKFIENRYVPSINASVGRSITGAGTTPGRLNSGLTAIDEEQGQIKRAAKVIIALGTNPNSSFEDSVKELIGKVKQHNSTAQIYWVNIFSPGATKKDEYNNTLDNLSSSQGFKVIDTTERRIDLAGDDIHPTADGSKAFANIVVDSIGEIESLVKESSAGCACSAPGASGDSATPSGEFNPDPAAVDIYSEELKPKIKPLVPLYQEAAKKAGLADWEVLPALHNIEFNLRRDNPTTNLAYKTPFQMNGALLANHGININDPMFQPGRRLSDDEFIQAGYYAAKFWLLGDARTLGFDATKSVSAANAAKMIVAYKSGAGSVWFTGAADFNLHAYAWAGYDTTPQHKLPMHYGPGSPYADEQTSVSLNKPGAATLFMLLKGESFEGGTGCVSSDASGNGEFTAVTGTKAELVQKLLSSSKIQWGNYGSATSQKSDIKNCLTDRTLAGFVAMAEQSGVKIPVNALGTDHGGCNGGGSLHNQGRAIDIGYYGNGDDRHTKDGDKLYKFIYDNWRALGIEQLIWQEPPNGYKCIGSSGPTDCYSYYGTSTMNDHYHHIHVGFKQ